MNTISNKKNIIKCINVASEWDFCDDNFIHVPTTAHPNGWASDTPLTKPNEKSRSPTWVKYDLDLWYSGIFLQAYTIMWHCSRLNEFMTVSPTWKRYNDGRHVAFRFVAVAFRFEENDNIPIYL